MATEIKHELHNVSKPESGSNHWWWWVYLDGKRLVGCHTEKEAQDASEVADDAYDAGRETAFKEAGKIAELRMMYWTMQSGEEYHRARFTEAADILTAIRKAGGGT